MSANGPALPGALTAIVDTESGLAEKSFYEWMRLVWAKSGGGLDVNQIAYLRIVNGRLVAFGPNGAGEGTQVGAVATFDGGPPEVIPAGATWIAQEPGVVATPYGGVLLKRGGVATPVGGPGPSSTLVVAGDTLSFSWPSGPASGAIGQGAIGRLGLGLQSQAEPVAVFYPL